MSPRSSISSYHANAPIPGAGLAWLALVLGMLHAAFSVYWALGGTWMLDTVGGEIERLGRAGDPMMLAIVWITAGLKVMAALAGPLAVRPGLTGRWHRLIRFGGWVAAVILTLYGGLQTAIGTLVTLGVVEAAPGADLRAIAWHAFFWSPWFLLWGLALGGALWRSRPSRNATDNATSEPHVAGGRAASSERPLTTPH